MSLLKGVADLVYTFRFLKLLVTRFEDTEAFKMGIIDKDGNRNKAVELNTSELQNVYTPFIRLVFNIKKIMAKAPGGQSVLARYAAALYLIKEKYQFSDKTINEALKHAGVDPLDFLMEQSQWFVLEDGRLSPGTYKLKGAKVVNTTFDELAKANDHIRVSNDCYPIGEIFGLNVYEAVHVRSNQPVYVTVGELLV
jgi:hypothetical protein